ncbi:MAG: hypothetical protein JW860_01720 [Sedimentisphaerales bacterium]|nr:hypothetical protein [Sedimentisphaerales bacterium]
MFTQKRNRIVCGIIFLGFFLFSALYAPAAVEDSARWLPADTMVMVHLESVNQAREKFKETSYYDLYKDPAMQLFMAPAEENIRAKMDEMMKELWQEMKLENPPQSFPWPQGRIMAAFFVQERGFMVPDFSNVDFEQIGDDFDVEKLPKREYRAPDFQVVVLADMGENADSAKKLARQIMAVAVEEGQVRQKKKIRSVEINIIKDNVEVDENYDTLCFGFKDNWLIAGSSMKYINEVVMRMEGSGGETLARQSGFITMSRTLTGSDLFCYVNAQAIKDIIIAMAPAEEKSRAGQMMQTLGFDNVYGLGLSAQVAAKQNEDVRIKVLLGIQGEKRGIPALIAPATRSTQPGRLLTEDLASFVVAHYDPGRIYDGIQKLVMETSNYNIDMVLQGAMAGTGESVSGTPPVDLRKDVFEQMASPLTMIGYIDTPIVDINSSKSLFAIGVKDSKTLDAALGRLHSAYIAMGNSELQRKLLNHTIYILPESTIFDALMMAPPPSGNGPRIQAGFTVTNDNLIYSEVKKVEQEIRNLQKEATTSINADKMFQYASRYLPAQAGTYGYQNNQKQAELIWKVILQIAQEVKEAGSEDPFISPWNAVFEEIELEKYCNLNDLPEFNIIKHHFGANVAYVISDEKGIYMETISLKNPF